MMSNSFTFSRRSSGLLLHPTSLPGHHGSGDLGPAAYRFADFLGFAAQTWWQMLPVNPPGDAPGNSPYSSTSAFSGSPYLISLDLLAQDGLLDASDLRPEGSLNGDVVAQFEPGFAFRLTRLRKAFERFSRGTGCQPVSAVSRHGLVARATGRMRPIGNSRGEFDRFVRAQRHWLDDWSLYAALRDAHSGASWTNWERDLRSRDRAALESAGRELADQIRFHKFIQFVFEKQWFALKRYCNDRGIGLIGDIPIFVAHDSADVWARPELFLLDKSGQPKATSGYPPDAFNADGQSWGHPQYHWPAHQRERFAWWVKRFAQTLRLFDGVRIDHFLGFHRTWHVPAGSNSARGGKWVLSPGRELFETVAKALPDAQIIAEDLGQLTPEASALRDRFGFPGMRIMQFGFGEGGSYHLPHTFPKRCVAYTGTHDNETIVGWFEELRKSCAGPSARSRKRRPRLKEYEKALRYLGVDPVRAGEVNWAFLRVALASCAQTVIFPVQDVLGLDTRGRMNIPGTADDNWRWRLSAGQLTSEHATRLRELVALYDRLPVQPLRPRRREGAKSNAKTRFKAGKTLNQSPSPRTRGEGRGEGRALPRSRQALAHPSP